MPVGKVKGSEVIPNRDSIDPTLMLQVEMSEEEDLRSVEQFTQPGVDCNPVQDSLVIVVNAGSAWPIVVAVRDGTIPEMAEGDYQIYSSKVVGGIVTKIAKITLESDGTITLENATGKIVMDGNTGQVDINNGNLTVDV